MSRKRWCALAAEGDVSILVIEQNIGVATQMSDPVAIMVNGRIHRIIASQTLAADRDLQQRLLGVGRHSTDETEAGDTPGAAAPLKRAEIVPLGPTRIYNANPVLPTRWSQDVPAARIEAAARTVSRPTLAALDGRRVGDISPLAARAPQEPHVIIAGTLDTKGEELRYIRDIIKAAGLRTRLVDLSTAGRNQGADVSAQEVALASPLGSAGIASGDRGTAVAAMTEAFRAWTAKQQNVAGIISAGGSGGTAIATAGMQTLAVGVPKIMISTMAAGNVAAYVGPTDVTMMHSVTDIQGLNRLSRAVLGNAAHAMGAMARSWIEQNAPNPDPARRRRAPARRHDHVRRHDGVRAAGHEVDRKGLGAAGFPRHRHRRQVDGKADRFRPDAGCDRRLHDRDLRHDDGRHSPGH